LSAFGFQKLNAFDSRAEDNMASESATFVDDIFEQQSLYDTTSFVLNRDSPEGLIRWNCFLLHNTNQFFIKVQTITDAHLDSLISLLAIGEELGIEVAVGELFDSLTHAYPEKTVSLRFYICAVKSGEPRPLDCAACKWVAQDELDSHEFPAADAALLDKLRTDASLWR